MPSESLNVAILPHGCSEISAGIYGYPLERAAEVALRATAEAMERHPEVEEARFWLFDQRAYDAFSDAL